MKKLIYDLQLFAVDGANTVVNATSTYLNAKNTSNNTAFVETGENYKSLSPEMKTFYDKALIELAGPYLVHDQFGQKRPIPRNGGKTIEFRQFDNLPKALTPITEGVTPAGNKLSVRAITATVEQYGDYIEQTDVLEMTSIDNTIVEATKKLAEQAGLTMDTVVRNALMAGTNVTFAKNKATSGTGAGTIPTTRAGLTADCLLGVEDVFRAAAILKEKNAPKINGSYVAVVHPYVAFDLMQAAGDAWVNITKYTSPDNILKGEIGMLGDVRFVESTEAKYYTATDASTNSITATVPVFCTLFLGADAYGVTDIAGGGIEHIVKQKGYGNDPLNQRSSIGWKGFKVAEILVENYMLRMESASSMAITASN